nr:hypothetical protein [Tanacetum cinerariifolium]
MLMTMEPEIQQNMEPLHAHEMLRELKTLFAQQAEQELLQTTRDFHSCRQEEGQSVSSYVLKIKGYIDNLERFGHPVTLGLGNTPALNAIRAGKVQKGNKHKKSQSQMAARGQNHEKGKNKQAYAPKPKIPPPPKREDLVKDSMCHECGETGHWKRNYPKYLAKLLKKKKNAASGAGGSGIVLNNCHYAPSITRGVISVSRFHEDGFVNRFVNNTIQHSRNNMVYFRAIPRDGIFEIDLSNSHTNARAFEKCVSCVSGKMARKPYTHQVERAKDLLGLIHTDVCGLFKIMSRQGASYFITFTDDFNHYGYVYVLKHKHEVFESFKLFQKEVENQLGKTIKSLRFDHGGEYMSQEFLDHLKDHRIIAHRTPPYTPQHNGLSERRNRTLLDMVRSMMSQTTLPKSFWDYTLETATRILNMAPTKKVERIPYKNSLINQDASGSLEDLEIIQEKDTHPSIDTILNHEEDDIEINKPQSDIVPIRRSTRTRHAPNCMCLYLDIKEHELGDLGEPTNYKVALLDPKSEKWLNAMNVEMQSMKDNEVWVLVKLPPNGKTVGSKWLFKKKTDMDGNIHTYKARLVVKGYTQTLWIDYEETFSPVEKIRAIRILIAIVAYYDYENFQIDVKTTFLNGYLNKEVYMKQPKGFVNPKYPNRTGYVFVLNGGAVDWKSAKQSIFVTLSIEAEYIAAFDASKEAVWVRKFIFVLGVVSIIKEPISMYCDNTGAIAIANESGITKGARHFRAKVNYLREFIEYGDIKLEKVHTDDNLIDPFTKD